MSLFAAMISASTILLPSLFSPPPGEAHGRTVAQESSGPSDSLPQDQPAENPWITDLDVFARELPRRHVDPFGKISAEEFAAATDDLKARVPDLKDHEILVSLMKIVASIGDSHTMLSADNTDILSRLPLELEWFDDGLYATRAGPGYGRVVGKRVLAIGDKTVEEATDLAKTVVPHENEAQLRRRAPGYLIVPEILTSLAIADGVESVTWRFDSVGDVEIVAGRARPDSNWTSVLDGMECEEPLYLRNTDKYYWFTYVSDASVIYAQYNACVEMPGVPFEDFTSDLIDAIDSERPDKLVFDIRRNGGGNSAIAEPLIDSIGRHPYINSKGRLFVVIGARTYSSAILNAIAFGNRTEAVFVGEPTGGKPNHHGEVRLLVLPKSWIVISYSTKYFDHSSEDTDSLYPDVDAGLSFSDFTECRDPALEAILDYE